MSDWSFRMIRENYAPDATFGGGSYETSLPVTNLQNYRVGSVARTTDAATGSTKITIDLGSPKEVGAIAIYNGNWSLDATYQVTSSNSVGMSPLRYDSGSKSFPGFVVDHMLLRYGDPDFWSGILRNRLLSSLRRSMIEVIPASDVVNGYSRYWEIDFTDPSNTDGYLQYSIGFIGPTFEASVNYGEDNTFGVMPISDVSESLSGSRTSFDRGLRRTWRGSFGFLEAEELFGQLARTSILSRQSSPVFIIPNQSDTLNLQLRSFPATFKAPSAIQQLLMPDLGATVLDFEEWL
jgi:hypothetical protein